MVLPRPAFVRLAQSSSQLLNELAGAPAGLFESPLSFTCAQVPRDFGPGSQVWVWLGSDNNKGVKTAWTQGVRALARCREKKDVGNKLFEITLEDTLILSSTIEKRDFLHFSPATYASELSEAAIIGLNNYASQVVQIVGDREFSAIAAMIAEMLPDVQEDILSRVPDAAKIKILNCDGTVTRVGPPPDPLPLELAEGDAVLANVKKLLLEDGWGGVLLVGVPGTGKSWYARQIAIALTGGERSRIREVQFHPSYQYEDFVEGYVPDGRQGFRLADKHMLEMAALAQREDEVVVLVIDEFSRTDPARVLGETMTYMEGSLRGTEFFLPSGRKAVIPPKLLFLATMNPEDRSVDEIDAAMERRWAKVTLQPSVDKLREFLTENGLSGADVGEITKFFVALQRYVEIGHAFFRGVKDSDGAIRLWENQLSHIVHKRFRFDPETAKEVRDLWATCEANLSPGGQVDAGGGQVGRQ